MENAIVEGINLKIFLEIFIPLSLYFVITLLGASLRDMLNTMKGNDTRFRLNRILIGAIFGSFLMLGLEKWLLTKFGIEGTILIALIIGSISFELFDRFSKLDEIIKILKLFHDFRRGLITLETTKPTEDDSDHEPNNSKDKPK